MTGRCVRAPVDVLTRRRFLQIGGTLSMGAILAACIGGGSTKRSPDSSGGAGGRKADATILRTLSSVEAVAITPKRYLRLGPAIDEVPHRGFKLGVSDQQHLLQRRKFGHGLQFPPESRAILAGNDRSETVWRTSACQRA